jgi:hypothetical protein
VNLGDHVGVGVRDECEGAGIIDDNADRYRTVSEAIAE